MSTLKETKNLPHPISLAKLLGPSFIILGLGLGSGEIILWPHLTANHGMGIVWAIVVGVTLQFFINMEVSRFAIARGESVFVGFSRLSMFLPLYFMLTTIAGFAWPGIGLAGATLLQKATQLGNVQIWGIACFVIIPLILSIGKSLYKTVERLQMVLILIGTPLIVFITLSLATPQDYQDLARGLVGIGDGYSFIPPAISLASFLGALAFSGAGGNLNLAQSFYVRDKGYGMGKYSKGISSLITNTQTANQTINLEGHLFSPTPSNFTKFKSWWRLINLEHIMVFYLLGTVTMITLAFLSYITSYKLPGMSSGINFVISQSQGIQNQYGPIMGIGFLVIAGLMLLATQLTVLDSTSRILTENLVLYTKSHKSYSSKWYYAILWVQSIIGISIITAGFTQPRELITISSVINAATMGIYIPILLKLNHDQLPKQIRPSRLRLGILISASALYLGLSIITLISNL